MDAEKLYELLLTNFGTFMETVVETLRYPRLRFPPTTGSNDSRTIGVETDPPRTKLNPQLFAFVAISVILSTTLHAVSGVFPEQHDLLSKLVVILVVWSAMATFAHAACRLFGGRGTVYDTISMYLQLSAVIYVVGGVACLVWRIAGEIVSWSGIVQSVAPTVSPTDIAIFAHFTFQLALLMLYLPPAMAGIHGFHGFSLTREAVFRVIKPLFTIIWYILIYIILSMSLLLLLQ